MKLKRERLLENVVDFGHYEVNIEQTSISDEGADYDQTNFSLINNLENKKRMQNDY